MPGTPEERLATIEEQLRTMSVTLADLAHEVDNGTPSRPSIRARLHELEGTAEAARKLTIALQEAHQARASRWNNVREWGGWVTAVVAVILSQRPWS